VIVDSDRTWHFACKTNQLSVGGMRQVHVYDTEVLLIRASEDRIIAMEPWCPHIGVPLVDGTFDSKSMRLTCPEHHMQISLDTGENVRGPSGGPARHYEQNFQFPVELKGDRIYVRLKTPQEIDEYFTQCGIPGAVCSVAAGTRSGEGDSAGAEVSGKEAHSSR
jgi:nitrite reductase/ring-hydroxylating ferredoxin subunit